eukprot:g10784.t1
MKRVREPFGQAGCPNSQPPTSSAAGKRGRQESNNNNDDDRLSSQEPPYGPFQALLAKHGVVWPSAAAMAEEDGERRSLGFSCRCNPSKLRVAVERALMHDGARCSEFVESMGEFMAGPVQALRRALLPLDCCSGDNGGSGGGGGGGGGGTGFIAAAVAAAGGASGGGNVGSGGGNAIHESLVKVLLRVDCIQPEIIDMLLEKIPELVGEEETAAEGGRGPERTFTWQDLPRLVLNQVRFLDHIVDSGSLTKKVLEVLGVLPLGLQRDMISYLPEVVDDNDHAEVVETLQSLKDSEPQLLVAVLDALGCLSLPPYLLKGITEDAMGLLDSAQPSTLPVLVRFLLETATTETAEAVVREIREGLRLSPVSGGGGGRIEDTEETEALVLNPGLGGGGRGPPSDAETSGDALTLEALRQGLRLRGDLAACFLKAISKTAGSERHSVVDLWVLFCLYANQETRKKVTTLFRRKISSGHFTEALMTDALHGRAGALTELFRSSLMGIADALVSSGSMSTRRYGASMYRDMFWEFSDSVLYRQEVVGALITHCGAGSDMETDSALSALSALASPSDGTPGLRPFAAFIRALMDYMQGYTHDQVRRVFRILCAMASPSQGGDAGGSSAGEIDDVHIFIRKHVAMSQMALKQIGIIGAVAFVEYNGKYGGLTAAGSGGAMLSQDSPDNVGGGASGFQDSGAADTISMLMDHTRSSQEGRAFLYDELALSAGTGGLGSDALDALMEMLSAPLTDEYMAVVGFEEDEMVDGELTSEQERQLEEAKFSGELCGGAVKASPYGNLDASITGQIAEVLILPLLASEDQQERMKIGGLCPLFSLLATCLRSPQCSGDLDSIEATLGAPIILADSVTVDNVMQLEDEHKEAVIGAHFAACDWIRELVNAFVMEPKRHTKTKLVRRISHLCRLEFDLLFMIKRHPSYRLPGTGRAAMAPASGGSSSGLMKKSNKPSSGAGSGKGKGKGKAPAKSTKRTDGEQSELVRDNLRRALRPLSPEAVLVLGFPGILIKTRDTVGDTVAVESVKVGLRGVHLLLQEMHGHLKRGLAPKSFNPAFARLREAASASSGNSGAGGSRPALPALELLTLYHEGGVFRSLWNLLEMVGSSLRGVEEEIGVFSGDVDDDDMLFPCLDFTLRVLGILCRSEEVLASAAGRNILRQCLADAFSDADADESSDAQGRPAATDGPFLMCFDKLEDFASTVQQLPLAVQLIQVMEAVATARVRCLVEQSGAAGEGREAGALSPHQKLSSLCLTLLQRDWSEGDLKFVYKSSTLGVLVRTHLRWAKDQLQAVEVMSSEVLPLLLETGDCLGPADGYPTLTAASFPHFYTPLLQALLTCWREGTDYSSKSRLPTDAILMRTDRMVLMFRLLIQFTKGNPTLARRPVLVSALRESKKIVQVFLKSAMSVLERAFESDQDEVMGILKNLQQTTRQMQSLCAHGKDIGDASMSKEAPAVKKLLEGFIFRVRSLAQSHDCLGAMTVGKLKNRGLDGELVVAPVESEEDDDEPPERNQGDESESSDSSDSDSGGGGGGGGRRVSGGGARRQEDDGDDNGEEEEEEDSDDEEQEEGGQEDAVPANGGGDVMSDDDTDSDG